jgi:hypothetical protein
MEGWRPRQRTSSPPRTGRTINCPRVAATTVQGFEAIRRKGSVVNSMPTTTIAKKTRTGTPASTTGFMKGPPPDARDAALCSAGLTEHAAEPPQN